MTRPAALLLLFAIACGGRGKNDTAGASGEAAGDAGHAVLARFQTLDDQVEKSRGKCPQLASAIETWLDGNAGQLEPLMQDAAREPSGEADEVEQHLERIFDRVLDAVAACKGQGGVDRAYARLDAFMEAT